jgi:hypothetical protein
MKQIIFISSFIILLSISVFAQKIEINYDGFFIDSIHLTKSSDSESIVKVIGQPSRKFLHLAGNIIWTYDNLGLTIYINHRSLRVVNIGISFVREDYEFSPRKKFKGKCILYGQELSKETTLMNLGNIELFHEDPNFHVYVITNLNYRFKVFATYSYDISELQDIQTEFNF